MILNVFILFSTVMVGVALFLPRVVNNPTWRATITPLASIIGSGFLILGPILDQAYGGYAPVVMAALCLIAFFFGSAIRFNIIAYSSPQNNTVITGLENLSSWVLAFAYIISVAYYLNLFGAFGVRLISPGNALYARLVTTGVFILILVVGWTRGFSALERMEQVSVSLKMAIIAGLFAGLIWFAGERALNNQLVLNPAQEHGWSAVTLAFGLIVTIQGFETSRYLGADYNRSIRIRSMRYAQYIASAIYVIYIALIAYVFRPEKFALSETGIIDMMAVVAPVLPGLLIAAALSAQFSAAVADTGGSGGLIFELTHGRIKIPHGYALLVAAGLVLTWSANIFEIISYASRAFALYYGLQSAISALLCAKSGNTPIKTLGFGLLAILGLAIATFGTPIQA